MPQLQPPVPLSDSLLWTLQRASYDAQGPGAWRAGGLPLQILSNPFVAMAYARVVHGLLQDVAGVREPVTVLELGAGSGRFAFHLLRALVALRDASSVPLAPFRVVMTDLAASNVDGWLRHPKLAPFVAEGLLDVAVFDLDAPGPLALRASGERVERWESPLVVVANYVFDSVPRDGFRVAGGQLFECLIELHSPLPAEILEQSPGALDHVAWTLSERPLAPDFGDPFVAGLVSKYMATLVDAAFTLPMSALGSLDWLLKASGGRMVLMASDKGDASMEGMMGRRGLSLARHGADAISMMVNFDAVASHAENRGGTAVVAPHGDSELVTMKATYGLPETPHTRLGWSTAFEGFGPIDCQWLMTTTDREAATPRQILSLLRLSRHDPRQLARFSGALVAQAAGVRGPLEGALLEALHAVWDNVFFIEGQEDTAFAIAQIMQSWGRFSEALTFYGHALDGHGPHPDVFYNRAVCHIELGHPDAAHQNLAETLALDPDYPNAVLLQKAIDVR